MVFNSFLGEKKPKSNWNENPNKIEFRNYVEQNEVVFQIL